MNITTNFSDQQILVLLKALDLYSRIACGQFEEIAGVINDSWSFRNKLRDLNSLYKKRSLHETPEASRIAYDIQQSLRYGYYRFKYPTNSYHVNYDVPIKSSKEELPKFEFKIIE